MTVVRLTALALLAAPILLPAQQLVWERGDGTSFAVVPGCLEVRWQVGGGRPLVVAESFGPPGRVAHLVRSQQRTTWRLPDAKLTVGVELVGGRLVVRLRSDEPRRLAWPLLTAEEKEAAFVVPAAEGVRVRVGDSHLMTWLQKRGAMSATADLSMPFVGVERGDRTVTCLLAEPHYVTLSVGAAARPTARFEHEWTKNRPGGEYTVVFAVDERRPLAAAMAYRGWLRKEGRLRTLPEKIAANPNVARLAGAPHVYVWGTDYLSWQDVPRPKWKAFARSLLDGSRKEDSFLARLLRAAPAETRAALTEIVGLRWPHRYVTWQAAHGLSEALRRPGLAPHVPNAGPHEVVGANARALAAAFPDLLPDPVRWGDGVSIALLDAIRAAGIDRLLVCTSDLPDADEKAHVAAHARELGYLFGPYDSFHSVHSPDAGENDTWSTAQFDRELWEKGRVVGLDGAAAKGFKKRGFHLSPIYARPWVERRVRSRLAVVPHSAWFVDCDAYGQFFDDIHPEHRATRIEDAAARRARLLWLSREHGLVVGSEGGSAVMTPVIHFGHGVMTPVIGWGDPRLTARDSEFYRGRYWPPDAPERFFRAVRLPADYDRPSFDPRDRLPLYQAVFGDCVITTHHWGCGSLRFRDHVATTRLLELLYLVPPLYHLNRERWQKDRQRIVRHFRFWSPLHRALAEAPLAGFAWLTEDRLVQRTTFQGSKGSVYLTANFDAVERRVGGAALPPRSVTVTGAVEVDVPLFRAE